ncbi:MAG: glycosyltransferase family 2 protein, partial [Anaerolineae bacterium]|nr:glycosyltransferase family 2 protein [Anaerolineae bacterium]
GLAALAISALIALAVVVARLTGTTSVGPVGAFALFSMLVLAVTGVSLFNLGATFNYLVALFHNRPVKQGLFGKPLFDPPLDKHFWWMGLIGLAVGTLIGLVSLVLALEGWPASRMWFYYLLSALVFLVGLQFLISWILMRVLEELSQRDRLAAEDLGTAGG